MFSTLSGRPHIGADENQNRGASLLGSLAAPVRAHIAAIGEGAIEGTLRPSMVGTRAAESPETGEAAQFAAAEAPTAQPSNIFESDSESENIEGEDEENDAPPQKAPPSAEKLAFLATLQRAKEGDLKAFEEIYQLYHRRIYNAVYGMLGDPDDAQDVTQDVFMRLHDALPTLRADEAFSTYLYRIALNLCRDRARRKKRVRFQSMDTPRADDDGDVEPMEFPDQGKLPEELLTGDELQRRVREAVLTLSTDHKAVIVMHHFQGMEVNDIARILSVPTGTVKSRLARGRDQLHRKLRSYLNF
ncbi:MAG: sigma-70 family RNA polymerase sigma factor [Armatimonadetes bacterium]|nr:sigma-70 family RNA polymerase sigma factor [Armatimonadota bacterium]